MVRVTNPAGQFGGEKELCPVCYCYTFYATWWFITLCILVAAGIVYIIYRYRVNQILALQKVRNKIARDLHDDIGSTLGSISFLSEAAKQQLQNSNTTGAEKMIAKIGENSREMVENMSDIVWSVNPKNDSAKYLIDRMRVFATDLVASSKFTCNLIMIKHGRCEAKYGAAKEHIPDILKRAFITVLSIRRGKYRS